MNSLQTVMNNFPVSSEEYERLEKNFLKLCHHQAWTLLGMNWKNNCSDEQEDILQDLKIAMLKACCYYKRQTYIQNCLAILKKYVKDPLVFKVIEELDDLWFNRKRHGANRQKFGEYQERIMEEMVQKHVPYSERPDKRAALIVDKQFKTYCKQITWNEIKQKGKKITKEKFWRFGMVSLSEFDYLNGGN